MSDPTPPADKPRLPGDAVSEDRPATDELPPLPDGGLGTTMPSWLQQAPSRPARSRPPETINLTTLTEGIEVPEWLRDLSRRVEAGNAPPDSPDERPLAEAVVKDAPEVGEPEPALDEPDLEAATANASTGSETPAQTTEIEPGETTTEDDGEPAPRPEPVLRFQVRSGSPTITNPLSQEESEPVLRQATTAWVARTSPAKEPPRSVGATILLLLLVIALVAVGVWYYWM